MTHLAEQIFEALGQTGLNQKELAEEMGVSHSALSHIMLGRRRPTPETLKSLCTAIKFRDYELAVEVIIGHLKDEVKRSGLLSSDFEIAATEGRTASQNESVERNLDTVREMASKSEYAAGILNDIRIMLENTDLAAIDADTELTTIKN